MKVEPGIGSPPRHDADLARHVDVTRLDTDFALAGRDHTRAVRPNQANAHFIALDLHFEHIEGRNAFGDADDQLDTAEHRFKNRVLAERRWHVDH